jgi:GTP:adenosylcobinamide-phosphate guanylyltransferase
MLQESALFLCTVYLFGETYLKMTVIVETISDNYCNNVNIVLTDISLCPTLHVSADMDEDTKVE